MDSTNLTRPKTTDTEDDLIRQQEDFFNEQSSGNSNLQPAASIQQPSSSRQRQSVFAQRRNIQPTEESDKKQKPNEVIGKVQERKYESKTMDIDNDNDKALNKDEESDDGFPKLEPIVALSEEGDREQTVFSQSNSPEKPTADESSSQRPSIYEINCALQGENFEQMMTEEEILDEQVKLKAMLDPVVVAFMTKKRRSDEPPVVMQQDPEPPRGIPIEQRDLRLPDFDFLKSAESQRWLHFNVIEPEKLEWTRDFEQNVVQNNAEETYEARFDFYGMLQPFNAEMTEANRHLFMHGGPENRPGLTLQDFFRLARSTNIQQRVAAFNAIAGILSIYNQGYYDGILELPIPKIFFLLRFGLDEAVPSITEAAMRALAYLFYNDNDEMLLDATFDTRNGVEQPLMDNKRSSVVTTSVDEADEDLESVLKNLNVREGKALFETNVDDYIDESTAIEMDHVTDFHLAEVNLIECFAKTNIALKIFYILSRTSPTDVMAQACIKVLIRLARSGRSHAYNILHTDTLMKLLIEKYLPSIEGYQVPLFIVLKLFRVLASFDRTYFHKLQELDLIDIVKRYALSKREFDPNLFKVQIEAFRLLRLYFCSFTDEQLFNELLETMSYHLKYHYNRLDFQMESFFLHRQHASALLQMIGTGNTVVTFERFHEDLISCLSKWTDSTSRHGLREYSQRLLLSATFDLGSKFFKLSPNRFYSFIDEYFKPFLQCPDLIQSIEKLEETSPLLSLSCIDRCNIHKPLINLGSIVRKFESAPPSHILSRDYAVHLFDSIDNFINSLDNTLNEKSRRCYNDICELFYPYFEPYLQRFSKDFNRNICTNWFLKAEIDLIYRLLFAPYLKFNDFLINVAINLVGILTKEKTVQIFEILEKVVLTESYYENCTISEQEFKSYCYIVRGIVAGKLEEKPIRNIAVVDNWNQIMLGEAWPYSILMFLLYNEEVGENRKRVVEIESVTEKDIIMAHLKFTLLLEKNRINLVSKNQKLMYIMLIYFGKNSEFLDADVRKLVIKKLSLLSGTTFPPRFNFKLNNEKSFESIYSMFLNVFKSNSYNDPLFGAIVLIPLAQRYDVKWRKLIWSEHVDAIRCISCLEKNLFVNINKYLFPIETDVSLLKCYADALASGQVVKDSIPYKIATHHLTEARKNANLI